MTRPRIVSIGLLCLLAAVAPSWFWNGGSLEMEATSFVVNYAADRPVLQRVFDPHLNDFDLYQARELSYGFDLLDAEFQLWLARTFSATFFIPLSAIIASILMIGIFLAGTYRTMKAIDTLTAVLLAACLITSFQFISTMGVFYRSSKPVLGVVVLALLFHLRRVYQDPARNAVDPRTLNRDALIAAILCCGAGLLDRQGAFFTMLTSLMLGIHFWRRRQLGNLFVAATLSAMLIELYNLLLGPLLIHTINGYWPDFSYQADLLGSWQLLVEPRPVGRAAVLAAENVGVLAGGFRPVGYVIVAMCCVAIFRSIRDRRWPGIYAGAILAAQILMFALMIRTHPPIADWVDHRFWYYPFPFVVIVMFAATLWLNGVLPRLSNARRRLVVAALVLVIMSNIATMNASKALMLTERWFSVVYGQSLLLKESLRTGVAQPGLRDEHLKFFQFRAGAR